MDFGQCVSCFLDFLTYFISIRHGAVGYRTAGSPFFPNDEIAVFYNNASLQSYAKGVTYYRNRLIKAINVARDQIPSIRVAYAYSGDFQHELVDFPDPLPIVIIHSKGKRYVLKEYTYAPLVFAFDMTCFQPRCIY